MSAVKKTIALLLCPVFVVGVVFWMAVLWFDVAKDWVLEIRQFDKSGGEG